LFGGQQQIDVPATGLDGKVDGLPAGKIPEAVPRRIISSIESGLLNVRAGAIGVSRSSAKKVQCQRSCRTNDT
jgi:hypothetical protein